MADFSLQALHDEIEEDPMNLGYKEPNGDWKGDAAIADLINDPALGEIIMRRLIQAAEIVESIDAAEWDDIPAARQSYIGLITRVGMVDANQAPIFDGINTTFNQAVAPNTRAAILAKVQKSGSRAEVLWGESTVVSISQVAHAANL